MALTASQLALATFGSAVGGYKTTIDNFVTANGEAAAINALIAGSSLNALANGVFAAKLVDLLIGSSASTTTKNLLANAVEANLNAGTTKAAMVSALANALASSTLAADATWGAAATQFQNRVTVSDYHAAKAGATTDLTTLQNLANQVTSVASTVTTAKAGVDAGVAGYNTFALTSSSTADNITTTATNDVITAALGTWGTTDKITDGSTTDADILNATIDSALTLAAGASISNIETINLVGKYGTASLDVATYLTGTKQLNVSSNITSGTATITGTGATTIAAVTAGTNIANLSVTNGTAGGAVAVDAGTATNVTVNGGAANDTLTVKLAAGTNALSLDGGTGSDAYTVDLKGGTLTLTGNTNNETLTLNSTTAANTVNATATVAATTGKIVLTGDQSITLKDLAANFNGVTLTDSTTGTAVSTVKLTNAGAAAADLSKVAADKFEVIATTNNTAAVTFANDAKVTWSDGTASVKVASVTDNAGTLYVTANNSAVKLEDGGNDFATVSVAVDTATTLTAVLATADTTLALTGAKDVTLAATTAAKALDASALTGKLTTTLSSAVIATVVGGAGDDTFNLGANTTVTVDGGAGTDTLKVTASATLGGALTNVEKFDVANGQTLTLTQQQLFTNGSTFTLSNTGTLAVTDNPSSVKTFNLSGLQVTDAATITITGSSSANTITGSAYAESITGGAAADTINAGSGNDTIVGGAGGDIINVGSGTDTIKLAAAADTFASAITSGTTTLTGIDVISGAAAGDIISLYSGVGIGTGTTIGTSLMSAGTSDAAAVVRGDYNATTGIFTASSSGADSVVQWDSNGTTSAGNVESIVLVGFTGTLTAAANALTLA